MTNITPRERTEKQVDKIVKKFNKKLPKELKNHDWHMYSIQGYISIHFIVTSMMKMIEITDKNYNTVCRCKIDMFDENCNWMVKSTIHYLDNL